MPFSFTLPKKSMQELYLTFENSYFTLTSLSLITYTIYIGNNIFILVVIMTTFRPFCYLDIFTHFDKLQNSSNWTVSLIDGMLFIVFLLPMYMDIIFFYFTSTLLFIQFFIEFKSIFLRLGFNFTISLVPNSRSDILNH